MSILVGQAPFFEIVQWVAMEIMQFHRTKMDSLFRTVFFLHFISSIEQMASIMNCPRYSVQV